MEIGLVDIDSHNFPNLALMKISAWHKAQGDAVEWASPLFGHDDKVYISKVFSFSPDDGVCYDAKEIIRGGSGYCISLKNGREVYDASKDVPLPPEVEHIYPDYSLYPSLTEDTAYGFLSRGCPRGCAFCHVATKEGKRAYRVVHLGEFWRGQKKIVLCDPNILACREWREMLDELADSKADIDINQGLDVRLMTKEKAEVLARLKLAEVHFAWDKYEDKERVLKGLALYAEYGPKIHSHRGVVYTLVNFGTTIGQDLERIYTLRDMGYYPYVMIYNKAQASREYKRLSRWVNNRFVFSQCERFEDYKG
jgi:hypothetical protein